MHIVCLEQGDWMNPAEYPSDGRDWEARQIGDFDYNPNRRGRETDYPINEENSPIKVANFNGVGGGTMLYAGHTRASIPRISGCGRWMASPTTGRSTTRRWRRSTPRTTA